MGNEFVKIFLKDIIASILSGLLISIVAWFRDKYILTISKKDPRYVTFTLYLLFLLWFVVNLIVVILVFQSILSVHSIIYTLILSSLPLILFAYVKLNNFWSLGIRGADKQIKNGIDYSKALLLVKNQLSFLGTGASKLTSNENFETAIRNCKPDQPIRFLLLCPTDKNLEKAAKRAARPQDEYKTAVLQSLKRIKLIKENFDINIQVKFYSLSNEISPIFRIMLIDNSICLLSYNVFGDGDGSQLPQLHIINDNESKRIVDSFYYPFERYFEWLWDQSTIWNYEDFL